VEHLPDFLDLHVSGVLLVFGLVLVLAGVDEFFDLRVVNFGMETVAVRLQTLTVSDFAPIAFLLFILFILFIFAAFMFVLADSVDLANEECFIHKELFVVDVVVEHGDPVVVHMGHLQQELIVGVHALCAEVEHMFDVR